METFQIQFQNTQPKASMQIIIFTFTYLPTLILYSEYMFEIQCRDGGRGCKSGGAVTNNRRTFGKTCFSSTIIYAAPKSGWGLPTPSPTSSSVGPVMNIRKMLHL